MYGSHTLSWKRFCSVKETSRTEHASMTVRPKGVKMRDMLVSEFSFDSL